MSSLSDCLEKGLVLGELAIEHLSVEDVNDRIVGWPDLVFDMFHRILVDLTAPDTQRPQDRVLFVELVVVFLPKLIVLVQ